MSSGYAVSILNIDPVPGSIINQGDIISVTVADNPALCIIDKTATVDDSNPVYIYKQGAAQTGYTVTKDTSVTGQFTYTIKKNTGWPSSTQEITYRPDLTTTDPNVYSTKANLCIKITESASFALAYLNMTQSPTAFQWMRKRSSESSFSNLVDTVGAISGSTSRILQLTNLTGEGTGQYKCLVTSPEFVSTYGTNTIDSSISSLYVVDFELVADGTPVIGESLQISVSGIDDLIPYITNYQWKRGGLVLSNNSPVLDIASYSSADNGTYTCTITVFEDTVISDELPLSA